MKMKITWEATRETAIQAIRKCGVEPSEEQILGHIRRSRHSEMACPEGAAFIEKQAQGYRVVCVGQRTSHLEKTTAAIQLLEELLTAAEINHAWASDLAETGSEEEIEEANFWASQCAANNAALDALRERKIALIVTHSETEEAA